MGRLWRPGPVNESTSCLFGEVWMEVKSPNLFEKFALRFFGDFFGHETLPIPK